MRATLRCRVKIQAVICDRLAVFLRVRRPNAAPETGSEVILARFRYINGLDGGSGKDHVTPVENNEVRGRRCRMVVV